MIIRFHKALWLVLCGIFAARAGLCLEPTQQLARDILEQLVDIDTADSAANVTAASEAMAKRLRDAGFPDADIHVDGDDPRFKNLVARYRGAGKAKPLLLLAHLDVVEALRSDWSLDPFHFVEKDGYFYGRGTVDDKAEAACWIANLIRYKQENFVPAGDVIVALTAGEESGEHNGVKWLLENHRDWIDAGLALNEGGDGAIRNGQKIANYVQASEKIYYSVELKATNPGGHSSVPRQDNAIYELASALLRVSRHPFPAELNPVTQTCFERTGKLGQGKIGAAMRKVAKHPHNRGAIKILSADPHENAMLRTTCVATRLSGGHADNALPQTATALVNCRVLPEDKPEEVLRSLSEVVDDPKVAVTAMTKPRIAPASPLTPEFMHVVEQTTSEIWPGVPVIPTMSTGATDSRGLRAIGIPCYGLSGFFLNEDDNREHGRDERMPAQSFFDGQKFLYLLVKRLSS